MGWFLPEFAIMEDEVIAKVKEKRNQLAFQMETLIQDFTNKTNYIVDKITVEYKTSAATGGLVPRDPSVRISIRVGGLDKSQFEQWGTKMLQNKRESVSREKI